jgi:hypothetical protein
MFIFSLRCFYLFEGPTPLNVQMLLDLDLVFLLLFMIRPYSQEKSLIFSLVFQLEYGGEYIALLAQYRIWKVPFRAKYNVIPIRSRAQFDLCTDLILYILNLVHEVHI